MTATRPLGRVGYLATKSGNARSGSRYFWQCRFRGVPSIVVYPRRGGVRASVDALGVDPSARMDATADVMIRAVLGQPHSLDGSRDFEVGRSSLYVGDVRGRDVDSVGSELAAIVQAALPFVVHRNPRVPGPIPRRDPDWPTLAEFYASRVMDEPTARAIRVGYFIHRTVKGSDYSRYSAYCSLASKPVIVCGVRGNRADIRYFSAARPWPGFVGNVSERIKKVLIEAVGRKAVLAANVVYFGSATAGTFSRIPASVAERVAFELADAAARSDRPNP